LGISHGGCTVVDEGDGTVIDDDEVLLELKDKTLILLASTDEWTPPLQPTSNQAKSAVVNGATSPTNRAGTCDVRPKTTPKHDRSSKQYVGFFEFMNELQSTKCADYEHLTAVARSLVDLDIIEDQWDFLWTNQTFLDFISYCEAHPPAAMHVVALLGHNNTAHKFAPKHILAKFNKTHDDSGTVVNLPKQQLLRNLSEVKECLQRIADSGVVPVQFLDVVESSIIHDTQLEREMTAANALICWSSATRTFQSSWNINTVIQALSNIVEYENSSAQRTRSRRLQPIYSDNSNTIHETEVESSPKYGTSSIFHRISAPGVEEYSDSGDEVSKVGPQRPSTKRMQMIQHPPDSDIPAVSRPNVPASAPEFQNIPKSGARAQYSVTSLLGGETFHLTQTEYYRISQILSKPEVDEKS